MHTDCRPRIKLPRQVHTALKTWASSHETTIERAAVLAVVGLVGELLASTSETQSLRTPDRLAEEVEGG